MGVDDDAARMTRDPDARAHLRAQLAVGLRGDPPSIRVQVQQDGTYTLLDHKNPIGTEGSLGAATRRATEIVGPGGRLYVQGWDGLVFHSEMVQARPAPHGEEPTTVSSPETPRPQSWTAPLDPVEHAPDRPTAPNYSAELTADQWRTALGPLAPAWERSFQEAKREEGSEQVGEILREGAHFVHALHPLLKGLGDWVRSMPI